VDRKRRDGRNDEEEDRKRNQKGRVKEERTGESQKE
jgi:hypothetical protein